MAFAVSIGFGDAQHGATVATRLTRGIEQRRAAAVSQGLHVKGNCITDQRMPVTGPLAMGEQRYLLLTRRVAVIAGQDVSGYAERAAAHVRVLLRGPYGGHSSIW
ncbi:MAG: hypothetical protein WA979_10170 [Pacificimonas sp.]